MQNQIKEIEPLTKHELESYLNNKNLLTLQKLKIHLDDLYYNTGESTLEDWQYDMIKDVIIKRDKSYIPTVGATLREGENRVKLPYWLGSADKITPKEPDALKRWLNNNPSPSYLISEKLDGVSCLLTNKNNKLSLYTRGDGVVGADISYLAKYFIKNKLVTNIPLSASEAKLGHERALLANISVRGE